MIMFFFLNYPATTEIYTLSLHDALPICPPRVARRQLVGPEERALAPVRPAVPAALGQADRKSTRLNSSHMSISYAVFCLKKKKKNNHPNEYRETDTYSACHRRPFGEQSD